MNDRYVVIMAGGKGERFWPQSRLKRPKQLLPIVGDKALLAQTIDRLRGIVNNDHILIITNREQYDAVCDVAPELPSENIIAEPVGRDTAAAVALATILIKLRNPEACFAMLPADQVIHNTEGFQSVLKAAFLAAEAEDTFVTIGIEPTYPATGYGYIERQGEKSKQMGHKVFEVNRFVEKPNLETAKSYIESQSFFWNAGMFVWRVPVISAAFAKQTPDLWIDILKIEAALDNGQTLDKVLDNIYPKLKKISVDFAIMENAESVRVIPSAFDWDDVGEWPAVERHYEADERGNVIRGLAQLEEANNNIVINEKGHLTALIGVDNLIVVQTKDATLICPKSKSQDIKKLVTKLASNENLKHLT